MAVGALRRIPLIFVPIVYHGELDGKLSQIEMPDRQAPNLFCFAYFLKHESVPLMIESIL